MTVYKETKEGRVPIADTAPIPSIEDTPFCEKDVETTINTSEVEDNG